MTCTIRFLSGTDIDTDLKRAFKLFGSFERPPYTLPAGFNVTKMLEFKSSGTDLPSNTTESLCLRIEVWIAWICCETIDNTSPSSWLNSSKQPEAPHCTHPVKMRQIDLTSMQSPQLNTSTCRLIACPKALTDSVLPVPTGP
jgi:hypothetical protein